jgi:cyclase
MLKVRIIPCLLIQDGGLVKTENFKNPRYLGDPTNAVKIFNEKEVDELILIDIQASRKKNELNWEVIEDLASECFMPLAYGGGINSFEQINRLISIGVEKVIINQEALKNPVFLSKAVNHFGTSTIVCAVDIKKNIWGKYEVYDHVKGKLTGLSPSDYIIKLQNLGVGEVFINNVNREGTFEGIDLDIVKSVVDKISIPLIICGGVSSLADISLAAKSGVSGISVGSMFVFQGPHRAVLISYPSLEDLKKILNN